MGVPKEDRVELLAWKLRVSMLWIFLGVGQLAAILAAVLLPDVLGAYIATGEFEGEKIDALMLTSTLMLFTLLPLVMAFLTLALRDSVNRYANAILGVVATVVFTWDVADHAGKELEIGLLIMVTMIIAGLLIVWHAWKWPKPAVQDLPHRRPASSPEHRAAGTM
jgi:undecaprenyl pyrophosphate phosphatase UppP